MATTKRKVVAYITHRDRLLVFRHPLAPDAGIQVPAGTVRDDEVPFVAVMREAEEETGLTDLTLVAFLGEHIYHPLDAGREETHRRWFYHLRCAATPPTTWQHYEPDPDEGGELPLFEFFWVRIPDEVPVLIAEQGKLLPRLFAQLGLP